MDIWHYHPTTGRLLGAGVADANPVEENAWLVPAFAAAVAPPDAIEGHEIAWEGGAWVQREIPAPPPQPEPPAPPAPQPVRRVAPFAFRRRLPAATRQAVTLAASRALERGDATLQTWLDDIAAARVIDLDGPELVAGVAAIHAEGLISDAERAALLADGTPAEAATL